MAQTNKSLLLFTSLLLTTAVIIWFYPTSGDFKVDNPFWNGLQTFSKQTNAKTITTLDTLPTEPKGTTLVIVPYNQFTSTELLKINTYVANGGTLILLDDYGYGNQILNSLNTDITFDGQPLIDPLFNYQNKKLPKITDFTPNPTTTNVTSIVLNHATILQVTDKSKVTAYSSSFSFIDTNNNQVWDKNETTGAQPVVAYQKIDQGYIVTISDPSILINSVINLEDNNQFIKNLLSFQTANPEVYIDQAHLTNTSLDQAKGALAFIYDNLATTAGTILLVTALFTVTFYPLIKRKKND